MMAGPPHAHQFALGELFVRLRAGAPPGLVVLSSPCDWVLWQVPSLTLRQPDLVVIGQDQFGQQPLLSPPRLVVEILSPTTRATDLREKRTEYARAGAPHYWVIDLDRPSIEALTLGDRGYERAALASGEETLRVMAPFPLAVSPAELLT